MVDYFSDKKSEEKFLRLYNISHDEFYNSGLYEGAKIRQQYLCWKYLINIRDKKVPDIPVQSKYEAVFIEFRCFPHMEFIIRNALIKLGNKWSHTIICGRKNYNYMTEMCKDISSKINIIKLDIDNLQTYTAYNELLTSISFWEMFHGEKILIHQEDSCIFKTNIDDFLKFDYIGAPWDEAKQWVSESGLKIAVGNGGFSLRTRSIMLDVIKKYNRDPSDNEDVYFSRHIQDNNLGLIPSVPEAYDFSSEGLVNRKSFGGHCYFNYDVESEERFVKECVLTLYDK